MNLTCRFIGMKDFDNTKPLYKQTFLEEYNYICEITNQKVPSDGIILSITGSHFENKTNEDVTEVKFDDCSVTKIPQGLTKIFPNMKILIILNSKLKIVKKADLAEYRKLEKILFPSNQIEYLPKDLFDGFVNLLQISFYSNNLKIIEPTIFDGLNKLITVDLDDNPNYSGFCLSKLFFQKKIRVQLVQKFCENVELYKSYIRAEFEEEHIFSDIKLNLHDDSYKDFKILVEDREFRVHKLILASRSPTLAEIIKNNPEVENLSLYDIPVDTFEIILNYIYTAELPKINDYDHLSLFAASGRLKIDKLKNYVAVHIFDQITEDNALDILKLCNRYEHNGLKQKSFDIIKNKYPKLTFKDEWIEQPESVRIIIEKFEEKEEAVRKLEAAFENHRCNL